MPKQKAFIILLNGVSSSGKTSIAKALGYLLPIPTLIIGIDNFLQLIPTDKGQTFFPVTLEEKDGKPITHIDTSPAGEKLCQSLAETTKLLADKGFGLIRGSTGGKISVHLDGPEKIIPLYPQTGECHARTHRLRPCKSFFCDHNTHTGCSNTLCHHA